MAELWSFYDILQRQLLSLSDLIAEFESDITQFEITRFEPTKVMAFFCNVVIIDGQMDGRPSH